MCIWLYSQLMQICASGHIPSKCKYVHLAMKEFIEAYVLNLFLLLTIVQNMWTFLQVNTVHSSFISLAFIYIYHHISKQCIIYDFGRGIGMFIFLTKIDGMLKFPTFFNNGFIFFLKFAILCMPMKSLSIYHNIYHIFQWNFQDEHWLFWQQFSKISPLLSHK